MLTKNVDLVGAFKDFLRLESSSGIVLLCAAVVAVAVANSPLSGIYQSLLDLPLGVRAGPLEIEKPLLMWVNDGLMAIFFFLVGLELKREVLEGELSELRQIVLPAVGAVGGMAVPALLYAWVNWGDGVALRGWAIPSATDIAFALAVIALLGDRVPNALKAFLVSIAIFDDLGAIVVIAIFYPDQLSLTALLVVVACLPPLFWLNRRGVTEFTPYLLIGVVIWVATLKSGVHATLAGVVLAMFIPIRDRRDPERSPLRELEHDLHTAVAYYILPLFAFVNAGVTLRGLGLGDLLHPVPLGSGLGLFLGKQIGVFLSCWVAVQIGLARLPKGMGWRSLYGVALLCGIGFTMSLFIGSLAFEETATSRLFDERLGIILGSLLSGLAGFLVLRAALRRS